MKKTDLILGNTNVNYTFLISYLFFTTRKNCHLRLYPYTYSVFFTSRYYARWNLWASGHTRVKSENAWQSRERTAINASRYIRFDISAHDFRSRNREARRARHTDGAERRMACARRDGYTPNLFEVWRCRRDLERDSRSLSGKDDGLFVGRDTLTYRRSRHFLRRLFDR